MRSAALAGWFFGGLVAALGLLGCKKEGTTAQESQRAAPSAAAPASAEPAQPSKPGVQGSWKWVDDADQTSIVTISAEEFVEKLTGGGLPADGITVKAPIARATPSFDASEGVLVLGPLKDKMKPYEAAQWYELEDSGLKWYRSGRQYDTVDEAAAAKGDPALARPYERAK